MTIRICINSLLMSFAMEIMCTAIISVVSCAAQEIDETKVEDYLTKYKRLNMIYNNSGYQQCLQKNASMTTVEDSKLWNTMCLYKYRWYNMFTNSSLVNVSESRRASVDLSKFVAARPYTKDDALHYDCYYYQRKEIRKYPSTCYSLLKQFNWYRHLTFWTEIHGDLMYTFDFVLFNNKNPHRKENQFWYVILYLKSLVALVANPAAILELMLSIPALEDKADKLQYLVQTKAYYLIPGDELRYETPQITYKPKPRTTTVLKVQGSSKAAAEVNTPPPDPYAPPEGYKPHTKYNKSFIKIYTEGVNTRNPTLPPFFESRPVCVIL